MIRANTWEENLAFEWQIHTRLIEELSRISFGFVETLLVKTKHFCLIDSIIHYDYDHV